LGIVADLERRRSFSRARGMACNIDSDLAVAQISLLSPHSGPDLSAQVPASHCHGFD
jgi:hypothetical protein